MSCKHKAKKNDKILHNIPYLANTNLNFPNFANMISKTEIFNNLPPHYSKMVAERVEKKYKIPCTPTQVTKYVWRARRDMRSNNEYIRLELLITELEYLEITRQANEIEETICQNLRNN